MGKSTIAEDGNRGAFVIHYRDLRSINYFVNTDLTDDPTDAGLQPPSAGRCDLGAGDGGQRPDAG